MENHIHARIDNLLEAVRRFARARVLVLGDVMLDRFIWGAVRRISPEAPVPVVEVESETQMLGGAANVLHNLIALGAQAGICGLVGRDSAGRQVAELLDDLEVPAEGLITCEDRQTTVKTRVVAHSQQVVRVDRENRRPVGDQYLERLWSYLQEQVQEVDAVIISDYAKGVVDRRLMVPLLKRTRELERIVTVDPKVVNMPLYRGASVITPNHLEAAAAAGIPAEGPDYVLQAGRRLLAQLETDCVLVTMGERGMTLFSPQEENHIPTVAKRVFDVTGAGDTVISTLTLGLVAGLSPQDAALLANFAAGVVVGEVGTTAVTAGRLVQAVEQGAPALLRRQ